MRRSIVVLALCVFALPLAAQNTDIEALAGLQFNFGNPGARSLGMGGAFLGLADDASAAEANPAGLTILRKPEISIEARNYQEQQIFTTGGTFPAISRTAFSHYSQAAEVTFASFVYPRKNWVIGGYYHQPLRNVGAGRDVDIQTNQLTGRVSATVPNFFLAAQNPTGPLSRAECEALRKSKNDFFACLEYTVLPFVSAVDVQERTYGLSGAVKLGSHLSVGATVRYQTLDESALTFRFDPDTLEPTSVVAQSTGDLSTNEGKKQEKDITYTAGMKLTLGERFSAGAVYKKGAKFLAPTFIANEQTGGDFFRVAETTFHIPDVYGVGISVKPTPWELIINADAVRVTYSHLVDDFFSINSEIRRLGKVFKANDVTEIHLGGEYAFLNLKLPVFIRAGAWRDPVHSVEFVGPTNTVETIADAILYPKGEGQTHYSIGAGTAWKNFQIDAAYDRARHYRVGSLSVVARF
jgi:long-subunit fatty acid transport protein